MLKKTSLAAAIAAVTMLSACGGGGGGGDGGDGGNGGNGGSTNPVVSGPLDPVQTTTSDSVITPLATATAGTPLQGVLLCVDSVVNQNVLDIGDAVANGLADPTTLASTTPEEAQATLSALVTNLSGLLTSLAGTASCTGDAAGSSVIPTTNPLAGTPLAPLGAALLPVLISAQQQLAGASGGAPLTATQLATILDQLADAFASGFDALPPEVTGAPVVGGALVTVDHALTQLQSIATLAAGGGSPTLIASSFQALVQGVVTDLLTQVLPVADLQSLAGGGASTDLLATLQAAVASLTANLDTSPTGSLPTNPLGGSGFASLDDLVAQFTALLPEFLDTASAGDTPLDLANGPLADLINSLLAPISGGGGGGGSGCLLSFLGLC